MTVKLRLGTCISGCLLVNAVLAAPIATSDRSSLSRLHAAPVPLAAKVLAATKQQWAVNFEITNQFVQSTEDQQTVILDGETAELHFRGRFGLGRGTELVVDIPWLHQSGGEFDADIENWHRFFNLPNGGRERQAQNQLRYQVNIDETQLLFEDNSQGVGDIALQLRKQWYRSELDTLSSHVQAELPTGSAARFTGSDSLDLALGFDYQTQRLSRWFSEAYVSAGWLWFGDSSILPQLSRRHTYYFTIAVDTQLVSVPLTMQLQGHGAMFRGQPAPLRLPAVQLVLASKIISTKQWQLSLGFSEDIVTQSSPDFTAFAHLSYSPK